MGLFDSFQFDPQSYNPIGGLLQRLQDWQWQQQGQGFQPMDGNFGNALKPSVIAAPPADNEPQRGAPLSISPTPMASPQAHQISPLSNMLNGISNGIAANPMTLMALGGGIMQGGLGKGLSSAAQMAGVEAQLRNKAVNPSETFKAMVGMGVPSDKAMAAIQSGNSKMIELMIDRYAKQDKFRPATEAERTAAGVTSNNQPLYINADTGEPKFGPAQTNVNVLPGESSYDKELGTGMAKRFMSIQDDAAKSQNVLGSLQIMKTALNDPNFVSGIGTEKFMLPFRQTIAALGGDPNAASPIETFRAQGNALLKETLGSLGAGVSNQDVRVIKEIFPNLDTSIEGNRAQIAILERTQERKQQVARMAVEYAGKNNGRIDGKFEAEVMDWANKNPMFSQDELRSILAAKNAPKYNVPSSTGGVSGTTKSGIQWKVN